VYTPFAEYMMKMIRQGSWEWSMIKTLNDSTGTKAKKAKLMLQAVANLRRKDELKEKLESCIGLKDDEMPALLLLEEEHFERMDFNKVVLVAGSWHYDCSQIASAMQTVEANFEYKEPASVGKSRFPTLQQSTDHIQTVGPSIVVYFRTEVATTTDPTASEIEFMRGLVQCPTMTDVIIVTRNGKDSLSENWKIWVSHLSSLKVHRIKIDMTEGRRGGVACLEVDAVACQPLCHIIEETLSSAEETLRQKMGTFHRKFDEMCELVLERVRESQDNKNQLYMEKTMESFHVQVGSCCSASKDDVDECIEEFANNTNGCNQFHLPNKQFLESAFAPRREIRHDFEEQPCKKFLQEVILGQLIQQSAKFASEAYTAFVEQYIEKIMTFFMEESGRKKQEANESGNKLLESYMASYENEFGRAFDETLVQLKNSKKAQAQEIRKTFLETVCSSVEDFEDFRSTRSIISKDAYVSMYVGIVVIEATPLLEAMIMPLIQDGADEYQRMIDNALRFYSLRVTNAPSGGQRTMKDIQKENIELHKTVEHLRELADNLQNNLQRKEITSVALETELHEQVDALQNDLQTKDKKTVDLDQGVNQLREQIDDLQNIVQKKDDEINSERSRPACWMFKEGHHWIPYKAAQDAEIEAAHQQRRQEVTINLPSGVAYKLSFPENDIDNWVQVNLTSGRQCPIRRLLTSK